MNVSCSAIESLQQWAAQERCSDDWIVIDQARIDAFANATEDRYWLHTQPERARAETPFGGSIAHGFLLLSLTVGDDVVQITGLPALWGLGRLLTNVGFVGGRLLLRLPKSIPSLFSPAASAKE